MPTFTVHPSSARWLQVEAERTNLNPRAVGNTLDGRGIFAIVVFAVVTLIVIWPIYIPIPFVVSKWLEGVWSSIVGNQSKDHQEAPSNPVQHGEPISRIPSNLTIQHPDCPHRRYIVLNHVTVPVVGILLLLATRTIGGEQIKLGIVGTEGIEPYSVLALFISLAYIAISLDETGLLRYLASHVAIRGGRSGSRLFYLLYGFFFTLGLLVGNDPVVLSGTAFLVHFIAESQIPRPDAWIWAQFTAANISSALLVSSNPTNIVIATGFNVAFPIYSAWMALPTLVSGLTAFVVIRLIFRNQKAGEFSLMAKILPSGTLGEHGDPKGKTHSSGGLKIPMTRSTSRNHDTRSTSPDHTGPDNAAAEGSATNPEYTNRKATNKSSSSTRVPTHSSLRLRSGIRRNLPHPQSLSVTRDVIYIPPDLTPASERPQDKLTDPFGAKFGSLVMAATLIILVGTSVTGHVKAHEVAPPGAALCLIRDIFKDLRDGRQKRRNRNQTVEELGEAEPATAEESGRGLELQPCNPISKVSEKGVPEEVSSLPNASQAPQPPSPVAVPLARVLFLKIIGLPCLLRKIFPTVSRVFSKLPLALLPFAFGMFILVESLYHVRFIGIMGAGLGKMCSNGGEFWTAILIGYLSVALCNLGGTNIGACILLIRAIVSADFARNFDPSRLDTIQRTAVYSLALGSNVGALGGTFAASLAGLLWKEVLRQGDVHVRARQFAIWSLLTTPLALLTGLIVLWAQVMSGHWPESRTQE